MRRFHSHKGRYLRAYSYCDTINFGIARTVIFFPVRDGVAGVLDRVYQRPGLIAGHGGIHGVHVRHHQHVFAISCFGEFLQCK